MTLGDSNITNIIHINNLYFGSVHPNLEGTYNIVGDPLFVKSSINRAVADFLLQQGSPAGNAGYSKMKAAPDLDVIGKIPDANAN